ncbi:hypothetical protein [Micromonospora sp. CPCC 206061]|uniref:hypothetical protein n=1 Tax=Micromonospora sp. CPCC 206061 TaxID=3122410 RepID=UPI002FF0CC32
MLGARPSYTVLDSLPVGAAACMIPAGENSTGGGDLGEFYRVNRVLDWDAFTVAPGP